MKEIFNKTTDKVRIKGLLSDDRIKLFVSAEKVGELPLERGDLLSLLKEHAPEDLIHGGVLDDIVQQLNEGKPVEERRVAKGIEPEGGNDGRLVFLVKRFTPKKTPPKSGAEEPQACFLSLKDLHLFDNVKAGTPVARIYPPKPGKDGRDALGRSIPAKSGAPFKAQLDKSLSQRGAGESGTAYHELVASIDGYLVEEEGRLLVREELAISGNIDYHFGNLDFIGSLTIKGDVLPGFKVSAVKGVTVQGSVQGGSIESSKGNVTVKGFVFGGDSGRIVCKGDFSCTTARQAHVEALGNITIQKEAYDCTLRSQKTILAEAGRLIGGQLLAVCGVQGQQLGNDAGLSTLIDLCSDIEMTTEYATLVVSIDSHEQTKRLIELHLGPYAKDQTRLTLLPAEYRKKLEKLLAKRTEVDKSLTALLAKKSQLLGGAHMSRTLRVNVGKILYPGVEVRAGGEELAPTEPMKGPVTIEFNAEEKKFVVGELKALECQFEAQPSTVKSKEAKEKV